jgi:hypothetical protein
MESITELKMHSICSQIMRERKKIQNSVKSGAGADKVCVPAWFAYQHLLFLSSKNFLIHTPILRFDFFSAKCIVM